MRVRVCMCAWMLAKMPSLWMCCDRMPWRSFERRPRRVPRKSYVPCSSSHRCLVVMLEGCGGSRLQVNQ